MPRLPCITLTWIRIQETHEFVAKYTDLPPMDEWKRELIRAILHDMSDDRETFRDLDNDSESVREGMQRWLCLSDDVPHQAAPGTGGAASAQDVPLLDPCQLSTLN
jgi:hypothetical protein